MRIIGGKLRGRKLISPSGREVRPTSDMAKQGIFNVLQFDIEGSRFVDLFSGSGGSGPDPVELSPFVLDQVVIPKTITVHLDTPASSARKA